MVSHKTVSFSVIRSTMTAPTSPKEGGAKPARFPLNPPLATTLSTIHM